MDRLVAATNRSSGPVHRGCYVERIGCRFAGCEKMVCIVGAMNSGYIGVLSVGSCEIRQFGGGAVIVWLCYFRQNVVWL